MTQKIVTIVGQVLFCVLVSVIAFIGLPIGNGWELVVLPIFFTMEALLVGWIVGRLFNNLPTITPMLFIVTLVLSGLGAAVLTLPGAWGFQGLLLPIAGAVIGYHLMVDRG